ASAPTEIYTLSLHDALPISFLQASEAGDRSNLARSSSTRRLLMASIGLSTKDMRGQKIRRQSRKRAAWRQPTLQRCRVVQDRAEDRKSTRLNSSHVAISYAV